MRPFPTGSAPARVLEPAMASALLLLAIGSLAPAAQGAESYSFEGTFEPPDTGSYHLLELDVPDGTAAIHVSYSYDSTGATSELFSNVVDIGLYDPTAEGYRGWSGSSKSSFTVALSVDETTDGYLPGPLPAGTWAVELGAGYMHGGTTTSWQVNVQTEDGSGTPWQPPAWQAVTLGGAGWYAGDLHCHSTHSDGPYPPAEVFAAAEQAGLDFIALTDHNSFTQHYELGELQQQYGPLLLRGMELTSYRGHANVFGMTGYVDYHGTADGYDVNAMIAGVLDAGAAFSINHPDHFGAEPAPGAAVSLGWTLEETDWSHVDFIEVVNGRSTLSGVLSNPLNEAALERWDDLLLAGQRTVAIGGSDDHRAGHGSSEEDFYYAPIGMPTTMVYAEQLSEAGIIAGLRSGQVYLRADSPDGPELLLTATCGGPEVTMGQDATGGRCLVIGRGSGAAGMMLHFIADGELRAPVEVGADPFEHSVVVEPKADTYVRLELRQDGFLKALSNPVFLHDGPGGIELPAEPDEQAGCACALGAREPPRRLSALLWLAVMVPTVRRRWARY